MEEYYDVVASVVLSLVLGAILIPLLGVLRHFRKEDQRIKEVGPTKKSSTPLYEEVFK
jgi:hypothetical protein